MSNSTKGFPPHNKKNDFKRGTDDWLPTDEELFARTKEWSTFFSKYNKEEDESLGINLDDKTMATIFDSDESKESIATEDFVDSTEEDSDFDMEAVLNQTLKVIEKRKKNWGRSGFDKVMEASFCMDNYSKKVDNWLDGNSSYFSNEGKTRRNEELTNKRIDKVEIKDHRVYVGRSPSPDSDASVDTVKYILSNKKKQRTGFSTMTIKKYCYSRGRMEELNQCCKKTVSKGYDNGLFDFSGIQTATRRLKTYSDLTPYYRPHHNSESLLQKYRKRHKSKPALTAASSHSSSSPEYKSKDAERSRRSKKVVNSAALSNKSSACTYRNKLQPIPEDSDTTSTCNKTEVNRNKILPRTEPKKKLPTPDPIAIQHNSKSMQKSRKRHKSKSALTASSSDSSSSPDWKSKDAERSRRSKQLKRSCFKKSFPAKDISPCDNRNESQNSEIYFDPRKVVNSTALSSKLSACASRNKLQPFPEDSDTTSTCNKTEINRSKTLPRSEPKKKLSSPDPIAIQHNSESMQKSKKRHKSKTVIASSSDSSFSPDYKSKDVERSLRSRKVVNSAAVSNKSSACISRNKLQPIPEDSNTTSTCNKTDVNRNKTLPRSEPEKKLPTPDSIAIQHNSESMQKSRKGHKSKSAVIAISSDSSSSSDYKSKDVDRSKILPRSEPKKKLSSPDPIAIQHNSESMQKSRKGHKSKSAVIAISLDSSSSPDYKSKDVERSLRSRKVVNSAALSNNSSACISRNKLQPIPEDSDTTSTCNKTEININKTLYRFEPKKKPSTPDPIVIYAPENRSEIFQNSITNGKVLLTRKLLEESIGSQLTDNLSLSKDFSHEFNENSKIMFYPPEKDETSDSEADILERMYRNRTGVVVEILNS